MRGFDELTEPTVIVDAADDWPARERWTHEYLMGELGLSGLGYGRTLDGELARDVRFPPVGRAREQSNVWVLPDGYVSELHFDLPHNLNTVIRGEKDVVLFHPRETRNLYPGHALFGDDGPQNSRVRLDDIGPRFSRVRRARYWMTTIRVGETLYIPPFFWHHVRSRGESIAANVWFHTEGRVRRVLRWPRAVKVAAAVAMIRRLGGR